jgi:hypothetical protein
MVIVIVNWNPARSLTCTILNRIFHETLHETNIYIHYQELPRISDLTMESAQATSALQVSVPSARAHLDDNSSPTQIDRFSTLPAKLLSYLVTFLDIKDIKSVRVTSSAF